MNISKTKALHSPMYNITNTVFSIVDRILTSPNSLTKPSEVRLLQKLIADHLSTAGLALTTQNKTDTFHLSLTTVDLTIMDITYNHDDYFHIPNHTPKTHPEYKNWVSVHFSGTNIANMLMQKSKILTGVVFRNLSAFLPPRSFLRKKDGSELEYELYSQIISILPLPEFFDMYPIAIDFNHEVYNNLNWSNEDTWSVKCAYADPSTFTYTWDIYSCYTEALSELKTRWFGKFALTHGTLHLTIQSSRAESVYYHAYAGPGALAGSLYSADPALWHTVPDPSDHTKD
ncbi:hypothetical protein NQ318_014847 [Aromia moschata]|uniref:Uncharacterized protein n=1 Tax=Aromia moschata TaxID=1265417 RepID=A0AAV8X5W1_9CUCU|nr:hypothetical protein NQ318_014847 [Aromia moschata]